MAVLHRFYCIYEYSKYLAVLLVNYEGTGDGTLVFLMLFCFIIFVPTSFVDFVGKTF